MIFKWVFHPEMFVVWKSCFWVATCWIICFLQYDWKKTCSFAFLQLMMRSPYWCSRLCLAFTIRDDKSKQGKLVRATVPEAVGAFINCQPVSRNLHVCCLISEKHLFQKDPKIYETKQGIRWKSFCFDINLCVSRKWTPQP